MASFTRSARKTEVLMRQLIHHEQVQQKKSTNGTMYYRDDIVVGVKLQRVIP